VIVKPLSAPRTHIVTLIHDMLTEHARSRPDGPAVIVGERQVSWAELDRMVEDTASALARAGVRRGSDVMLALSSDVEFVATYLAVGRLGGALVTVDPGSPQADLERVVTESAPTVVVCGADQEQQWARTAPDAVVVRADPAPSDHPDDGNPTERPTERPEDPCVRVRSSGTTGIPTVVTRSFAHQQAECQNISTSASIDPDDVIVCLLPLHHSFGQFCGMSVAVHSGATLVLPRSEAAATGSENPWYAEAAFDLCARHGGTVLIAVPYMYDAIAQRVGGSAEAFATLRLALTGSNFLADATTATVRERFGFDVRGTYGSTEAGSVAWDRDAWPTPGTVGRPLDGVDVRVVSPDGRSLGPGETGEIVVAGAAVVSETGEYHTGDLGHLSSAGHLVVSGRLRVVLDIGGRKVNPVEVEDVLRRSPQVREAAATGVRLGSGDFVLVALVVPAAGSQEVNPAALRRLCADVLPATSVPARVLAVDHIPVTALGKVRRPGLEGLAQRALHATTAAPTSTLALTREDAEAFLLDRLKGRESEELPTAMSPMRALGLDSLEALRLAFAVQEDLHRAVHPSHLLSGRTVRDIADALAASPPLSEADTGRPTAQDKPFPMSANQMSLWYTDQLAPGAASYNLSWGGRVLGELDVDRLTSAFEELVGAHPSLRTTFAVDAHGRGWQRVGLPTVDLRVLDVEPDDLTRTLRDEAVHPFDLTREYPLRVRVVRSSGDVVLLVVNHHIATDFWSMSLVLRDLARAYVGDGINPSSPSDYGQYVRWQQATLAGADGAADVAYWSDRLSPLPPNLELPSDTERPRVPTREGDTVMAPLSEPAAAAVRAAATRLQTTPYTVLLAVFAVLLARRTRVEDLAVAAITNTRGRPDFAEIVGYFVNPVICRVLVRPGDPFDALVERVRTTLLEGYEHQAVPFPDLVGRLRVPRDPRRAPITQVAFGQSKATPDSPPGLTRFLSGAAGFSTRLGSLVLESVPLPGRGTTYDFSGAVHEDDDGFVMAWEYNTDLYAQETVTRVARDFDDLILAVVEGGQDPLPTTNPPDEAEPATLAQSAERPVGDATLSGSFIRDQVLAVFATVLGNDDVGPDDDFFDVGGDSITAVRAVALAGDRGITLKARQIFENPVLGKLADVLAATPDASASGPSQPAEIAARDASGTSGEVPLTPVQRWFQGQGFAAPDQWNQSLLLEVDPRVSADLVERAVRTVLQAHEAFRLRFPDAARRQVLADDVAVEVRHDGSLADAVPAAATRVDIANGPLAVATLVSEPGTPLMLHLTAHHLVVDFASWQIIRDELVAVTQRLLSGGEPEVPPEPVPFSTYARRLERMAEDPTVTGPARTRLSDALAGLSPTTPPAVNPATTAPVRRRMVRLSLPRSSTGTVSAGAGGVVQALRDVFTGACLRALSRWAGADVVVDLERHGRDVLDDLDLGRSVGWFTVQQPVAHGAAWTPARTLRTVRDAWSAPWSGAGPAVTLAAAGADDPATPVVPPRLASVNFAGSASALFVPRPGMLYTVRPTDDDHDRADDNHQPYPLELSGVLKDGGLSLQVAFDERMYLRSSVEQLAAAVLMEIGRLAAVLEDTSGDTPR